MENNSLSVKLCDFVISSQHKDVSIICETFSDKINNPDSNTFYLQSEVLEKLLNNIRNYKKKYITLVELYKGITMENLKIIKNLDLENKLTSNYKISSLLGIDYFDEKLFLEIIDKEVKNITSRYNLKAGDDYNKLANFLLSIKYSMQSSDDSIATLENLYQFFKGHANKKSKEEYITIYNKKIYKIDILKNLINIYSDHIRNKDSKEDDIIKRCSK